MAVKLAVAVIAHSWQWLLTEISLPAVTAAHCQQWRVTAGHCQQSAVTADSEMYC